MKKIELDNGMTLIPMGESLICAHKDVEPMVLRLKDGVFVLENITKVDEANIFYGHLVSPIIEQIENDRK